LKELIMKRHAVLLAVTLGLIAHATAIRGAAAGGGTIAGTVSITGLPSGANTVVFIENAPAATAPSTPVEMNQRGQEFIPKILPVVTGTTVRFLNSDSVAHNVFSPDYEKYDLGTWAQGQTKDYAFVTCAKAPCAYTQLCKAHPQMDAYIVVLQNQYFAVTDSHGRYVIQNVPPGNYMVGVWHARRYEAPEKAVTVTGNTPAAANFQLNRARRQDN
jgi:plastocyanin